MWQYLVDMFIFQDARYKTLYKITINQFGFPVDITKGVIGTLICNQYTYVIYQMMYIQLPTFESAGGVVVTGRTGSIPDTGSRDIKIWLSTLGTVYPS